MVRFRKFWESITEPSPAITDPDDRQRARLLASILLALVGLSSAGLLMPVLFQSGYDIFADPVLVPEIIALVLLAGIYRLCRSRFYSLSAKLTVAVAWAGVLMGALSANRVTAADLLYYLLVPIFLASIFLSLRFTIAIGAVSLVMVLAFPNLAVATEASSVVYIGTYLAMLTGLIVVSPAHQNRWPGHHHLYLEQQSQEGMF